MFSSILEMFVVEGLMLISGVAGWFMHSAWLSNAVASVKSEVEKVVGNAPVAQ